jgi:tRNA-2-methylthio-N6-dimethylallyladenosine synthase
MDGWMKVYIETYGCQMNVADSELIAGVLAEQGFEQVDTEDDADIVLLNTCAVREKAEERIFGRLGWLKSSKAKRPELVIGVAGCMAEHLQQKLVERTPYVDMVVGPDAYRRLPELIRQANAQSDAKRKKSRAASTLVDVRLDKRELYQDLAPKRTEGISGWISVMRGCDKFCTFCVVPYTRGRERSLAPDEVVKQAIEMEQQGFREVTLLGQTVSSYKVNGSDFAGLLRAIHARTSLRIRFTSPYPTDFDDNLLDTLAELPRVGRHLHLPVQSGSTAVLDAMNRQYTAEQYLELIERIEKRLPDFYLTTDFIVGFPDESDDDFEKTLALARRVRFDSAFMFKYSERSGTKAAKALEDNIDEDIKSERLHRLIKLQETCSQSRSAERVGQQVDVLIEGRNKKGRLAVDGAQQLLQIHDAAVEALGENRIAPGSVVRARVDSATTHTLFATPLEVVA